MAASLHLKLLTDISDSMDGESPEFRNFEFHMTQFVPPGILKTKPNLLGKFEAMKSRGTLGVGRYGSLKKVAQDSGNNDILELITKREPRIRDALAREDQSRSELNRSQLSSAAGPFRNATKRRYQEIDHHQNPMYGRDDRERGEYDTVGMNGYVLIINYEQSGLGNDVRNLQAFFETQLAFEVKIVTGVTGNHASDEVWRGLESAREALISQTKGRYYAFFCFILSHGKKDGITVKDKKNKKDTKNIHLVDVYKYFSNSELTNFAGRPKLFFIQTCRCNDAHGLHEVDDAKSMKEGDVIDESDEMFKIPTEADTFVAYSNTQDNATFGATSHVSTQHTCFINAILPVFERFHRDDHVEDMMISVRETVAEKRPPTKQMPCIWSTLTKRLYLKLGYVVPVRFGG